MANLDAKYVRESLRILADRGVDVFGASVHRYQLNPALAEAAVSNFERLHAVTLPSEYRDFITQIGDGGAGPFYGVFPLGKMDGLGGQLQDWAENDGFIGVLSAPFRFSHSWNDLDGKPDDELRETDEDEYQRRFDEFESKYFRPSLTNGAIPMCHEGCALRIWLVITGKQSGSLWRDMRSEYGGLTPLKARDGTPASFCDWYREWLDAALAKVRA